MQVGEARRRAVQILAEAGAGEATRKAELLLMHVLETDRAGLLSCDHDVLAADFENRFFDLVDAARNRPVHRVMGYRNFHGLDLALDDDTLEPRDDTEALVEIALNHLEGRKDAPLRFADLGTGTGAVALALLGEMPNASAVLTDIAVNALETAKRNAETHGLLGRCAFAQGIEGEWCVPLTGTFDFIVSNPPYIVSDEIAHLDEMVSLHDPRAALDGGEGGLDAYRLILAQAGEYLNESGFLALEIGYNQLADVKQLATDCGWRFVDAVKDLAGNDRAVVFKAETLFPS